MGDFHEPYGAIFGEFDKLVLYSYRFGSKSLVFSRRETLEIF
jgi:hypothetical protein